MEATREADFLIPQAATEMEMATPEIFWRYTGARRSTHKLTVEVAHRS
jgi:hypothetical protein